MLSGNKLKEKNWQDVTEEECRPNHWWNKDDEWAFAAIRNCMAYGDIAGSGLDVRCSHNDELVELWQCGDTKLPSIHDTLVKNGWRICTFDEYNCIARKGDTEVTIEGDHDESGYMTTTYIGSKNLPIWSYYDNARSLTSVALEKLAMDYFSEAEKKLSEEVSVGERIAEGGDTFTSTDCEYLTEALEKLRKGCEILKMSQMGVGGIEVMIANIAMHNEGLLGWLWKNSLLEGVAERIECDEKMLSSFIEMFLKEED